VQEDPREEENRRDDPRPTGGSTLPGALHEEPERLSEYEACYPLSPDDIETGMWTKGPRQGGFDHSRSKYCNCSVDGNALSRIHKLTLIRASEAQYRQSEEK
jgi:hypothetical protein